MPKTFSGFTDLQCTDVFTACSSQLAPIHEGHMPTACSKAILSAQYSLGADNACMSGDCSNDVPAILLQKL